MDTVTINAFRQEMRKSNLTIAQQMMVMNQFQRFQTFAPGAAGSTAASPGDTIAAFVAIDPPDEVHPGDLITSDWANKVVAAIAELNTRTLISVGAGIVQVTQATASGDVESGLKLTVTGTGFGDANATLVIGLFETGRIAGAAEPGVRALRVPLAFERVTVLDSGTRITGTLQIEARRLPVEIGSLVAVQVITNGQVAGARITTK